eukprot:scaffold152348_cov23-Tisochrysis_lutea.AAC.1
MLRVGLLLFTALSVHAGYWRYGSFGARCSATCTCDATSLTNMQSITSETSFLNAHNQALNLNQYGSCTSYQIDATSDSVPGRHSSGTCYYRTSFTASCDTSSPS